MKRTLITLAAGIGSMVFALGGTGDPAFEQGLRAYLAQDYSRAAECFTQSIRQHPSAGAFHNLGNAEWHGGHGGAAILAWERARCLDPFDKSTRANLRFARKTADLDSPVLTWFEICSTWLPVNAWAWIAAVSFWLAMAMLVLPVVLHWRRADWRQALSAGGFAVFLLTLPGLVGVQSRTRLGIVVNPKTALRLTPTEDAQTMARLGSGAMARLERIRGQYIYVRLANETAGWVRRADFGLIQEAAKAPTVLP